jgi:nucleoside-triphosphatase
MTKKIFLTGLPGSGKTTAIQSVIARLNRKANGFITQELRDAGKRKGFKIITLEGEEEILAHVDRGGVPRIGKYGVNLEAIDTLGVKSLRRALEAGTLAVVDEIGPMEILSEKFCQVVLELLQGDVEVLGTIVKRSRPFTDKIKSFPNVTVLEIHPGNRDRVVEQVLEYLES